MMNSTNLPAVANDQTQRGLLHALERLNAELAHARRENRRLMRLAGDRKKASILRRAEVDAKTLLTWRINGLCVSRSSAYELGMSFRRWEWARALLLYAGVHNGGDIAYAGDLAALVDKLDAAVKQLEDLGSLEPLQARRARRDGIPKGKRR